LLGIVSKDLREVKLVLVPALALSLVLLAVFLSGREEAHPIGEPGGDVRDAAHDILGVRVVSGAGDSLTLVIETRTRPTDGSFYVGFLSTIGDGTTVPTPHLLVVNASANGTAWTSRAGLAVRTIAPRSNELPSTSTQTVLPSTASASDDGLSIGLDLVSVGGERFGDHLSAMRLLSLDAQGTKVDQLDTETLDVFYISKVPRAAPERVRSSVTGQLSFGAVVALIGLVTFTGRLYGRELTRGTARILASYPVGLSWLHFAKSMSIIVAVGALLLVVTLLSLPNVYATIPGESAPAVLFGPFLALLGAVFLIVFEAFALSNILYSWHRSARHGPTVIVPIIAVLGLVTTVAASGTVVSIYSTAQRELAGNVAPAQELADVGGALTTLGALFPFRLAGECAAWITGLGPAPGTTIAALVVFVLLAALGFEAGRRTYVDVFFND
jgi:ABC-type transport system involved in multi-copper enzyme maturation permease subunit